MDTNQVVPITSITAAYRWTAAECIRSNAWKDREDGRELLKLIVRTFLSLFVPFLLFFVFVVLIVSPDNLFDIESWRDGSSNSLGSIAQLIGLLVLLLGTPWMLSSFIPRWLHRRRIREYFNINPGAERNTKVTIDAQELTWDFGNEIRVSTGWQAYVRVVRSRDGFWFMAVDERTWDQPIGVVRTWIPAHAFQSEQDIAVLRQWARQYVSHYDEIH